MTARRDAASRNSGASNDRGLTLIELLIAGFLSVLVLLVVAGILINSFTTQTTVAKATSAGSESQLVSASVGAGVRASAGLDLTDLGGGGQLLRARIIDDATSTLATGHCVAWYFDAGQVRTLTSSTDIPVPTSAADVAGWTLLTDKAAQVGTAPVFAVTGSSVKLTLRVAMGTGLPVLIDTTHASRQPEIPPTGVESLCF